MPRLLLYALWLSLAITASAQPLQLKPIATIRQKSQHIAVDKLQQWYTIYDDYRLQKYSADGRLLYEYGENNLGKIAYLDVSNPLQILVYYDEYSTAVLLDRTLSPLQRIDLSALGIWQSAALAVSNDNQLWLYDPSQQVLRKISASGEIVQESPNLSFLVDADFYPTFLLEANNRLYLNDPQHPQGVLVFDNLGNYLNSLPVRGVEHFQLWNGLLFYYNNNHIYIYDGMTTPSAMSIPAEGVLEAAIGLERLCLRYADRVEWLEWRR